MGKKQFAEGLELLKQPVLPLVSMVQFLFFTGSFNTVDAVIAEMPEPIETGYAVYEHPRELLNFYLELLRPLEDLKNGGMQGVGVITADDEVVDGMTAATALMMQKILTAELEKINSALCEPCGCRLCCIGPDDTMTQEFFEIPLTPAEANFFAVPHHGSEECGHHRSMDVEIPQVKGRPFYEREGCAIFHWQNGWSLILPKDASCPNLDLHSGRCGVYDTRPEVCRRPQIFPYILESLEKVTGNDPEYRLRQSLLAIVDCPYVNALKDEIAGYAAACELEMIFKRNKA